MILAGAGALRADSFFLASVAGPGRAPLKPSEFHDLVGVPPTLLVRAAGYGLSARVSSRTYVCRDPRDGITLVLHGEIYERAGHDPARLLLERYRRSGPASIGGVDGSYAVLVADRAAGSLHVVTDRLNSRRVFSGRRDGVWWLSTAASLRMHPLPDLRPDVAGVAHSLVNGLPYNGRTPFRGLSVLAPASVHTFRGETFRETRYWSPELTDEHEGVPEAELRAAFHDLLLEAVRKRTRDAPRAVLSLSGGWDSTAILGAAHAAGSTRLECFSYGADGALGEEGTDAAVARRMAGDLGHPYRFITGYADDLGTAIHENGRSHGTAQVVMETDVWRALMRQSGRTDSTLSLLLGDQGVGTHRKPLARTLRDVLLSLRIRGMEGLSWLSRCHPDAWDRLHAVLEEDLQSILDRVPPLRDVHDVRYWLYMDQYLPRLLAWREFFTGPSLRPRYPLLDHRLLDFVAGLPSSLRQDKRLLRETATEYYPRLFRHARAAMSGSPSVGSWCVSRLRRDREWARSRLLHAASPLDGLVPPGLLLDVLEGRAGPGKVRRGFERLGERTGRWLAGSALGASLARRLRMGGRKPTVRPPLFLVRALSLRELFANRAPTAVAGSRADRSARLADALDTRINI